MIDKMLSEIGIKSATEDENKAVNSFVINIDLDKNEHSGRYTHNSRIRFYMPKEPKLISADYFFKADVNIKNLRKCSKDEFVKNVGEFCYHK